MQTHILRRFVVFTAQVSLLIGFITMRASASRFVWRVAPLLAGGFLAAGTAGAQTCSTADEVLGRLEIALVDGTFAVGESSSGGRVLMRLAAWRASPQIVDETRPAGGAGHAAQLAIDLLPRGGAGQGFFLAGSRFRGSTPAEQDANQQAFLTACAPTMRELAPVPPFRVVIADRDRLGRYDAARGGVKIPRGPNYLHMSYYSDFLVPRSARALATTDDIWPMSQADAEALFARLDAAASSPSTARDVQAVAIVKVTRIDPATRAAAVELEGFALYDGRFGERLYGYDLAPGAGAAPQAAATRPPTEALQEGYYATRAEAAARALQLCQTSTTTAAEVRCDCIAERAGAAWETAPEFHIYTLLNNAVTAHRKDCENTRGIHRRALESCVMQWPGPMFLNPNVPPPMTMKQYCHCYADRTLEIGGGRAKFSCAEVTDYPVPADSPLPD
jgi:hypothetical protein